MAFGADGVVTACRTLGGLDDLAGLETARADAQAPDPAVDQRPDALEVGFEPPRRHIVRVADISPDDRALSAEFAAFRHKRALGGGKALIERHIRGLRGCTNAELYHERQGLLVRPV